MLNLSSLSTQSLASCVNYFVWNCLTCFSNTKIGSVTSFSILFNFQGPVAPQPCGWRLDYFITEVIFCQALFSKFFVSYRTWSVLSFSALAGTFGRLLVLFALLPAGTQKSFFCLSAWRSSIIPYAGPDVNTFLQVFSGFFALTQIRFILLDSSRKASRHRRQKQNPHRCFLLICGGSRDIITWTVPATKKRNHDTQKQSKGNSLKMQLATILQAL